jgi:HlyD family secretion protein
LGTPATSPPSLEATLTPRSPTKQRWRIAIGVALALAAGIAAWTLFGDRRSDDAHYRIAAVERGDVVVTVTATGVLHPLTQVDVGSEVSGVLRSVEVNYNDRVKKGQVLARLDTDQLQARVLQAGASLESAQAARRQAAATLRETQLNYHRCEKLAQTQMCSQQDLDQLEASWLRAQAAEAIAIAQVSQAQANLQADQTALRKAVIVAPIDGIVLSRLVEPGQTVAATFQTPLLFTLAEDLSQMQLKVDVDEADIGQVREGQSATFSVDAYPHTRFDARVASVRFAPKTVQGVVTYEAVLDFDNTALLLRPGMTATADIVTKTLTDVLRIPNAALRFKPPGLNDPAPAGDDPALRTVWVLGAGSTAPTATHVRVGDSDGHNTVLTDAVLTPGAQVVVDIETPDADKARTGLFPRPPH